MILPDGTRCEVHGPGEPLRTSPRGGDGSSRRPWCATIPRSGAASWTMVGMSATCIPRPGPPRTSSRRSWAAGSDVQRGPDRVVLISSSPPIRGNFPRWWRWGACPRRRRCDNRFTIPCRTPSRTRGTGSARGCRPCRRAAPLVRTCCLVGSRTQSSRGRTVSGRMTHPYSVPKAERVPRTRPATG